MLGRLSVFAQLSKVRLSSLVVASTAAGYGLASVPLSWTGFALACGGTALCAAAANTFNQCYEVRTDALMARTRMRPLPAGQITLPGALAFGTVTGVAGVGMLYAMSNPVAAVLGASNIALYSGIYTPFKQYSIWNTTIGSVVGAIPPVMGFVAAAGLGTWAGGMEALMSYESAVLASLLFLWQGPHFYALAWYSRKDYERGNHKMVTVTDPTGLTTASLITGYSVALTALPFVSQHLGVTCSDFSMLATGVNAGLLACAAKFHYDRTDKNAKRVFHYSLAYLPVLMGMMVVSNWRQQKKEEKRKCPLGVVAHPELCVHDIVKDTHLTPTCDNIKTVATEVVTTIVEPVAADKKSLP